MAPRIISLRLQEVLARLFPERGGPGYLRSDNGPEFLSRSLAVLLSRSVTESRFIAPGSPWQNGHAESLVSRLRAEFLGVEVFSNLADAEMKLAMYRRYYNDHRPHSSLGYGPPAAAAHIADVGRPSTSLRLQCAVPTSGGSLRF
jgi:transposase InsO family protein